MNNKTGIPKSTLNWFNSFAGKLTNKQAMMMALAESTEYPLLAFDGGIRAGKTTWALFGFVKNLLKAVDMQDVSDSANALVAGVGKNNVDNNIKPIFTKVLQICTGGVTLKADKYDNWHFVYKGVSFKVMVTGADKKDSQDRIQGSTFRCIFLDEAALFDERFIDQALGRTVSFVDTKYGDISKVVMSSNPEDDKTHWYYKKYIASGVAKHVKITSKEGGIVKDKTLNGQKMILSKKQFARMYLGEWVSLAGEGAFPNFKYIGRDFDNIFNQFSEYERHLFYDWGYADSTAMVDVIYAYGGIYVNEIHYHSPRETGVNIESDEMIEKILYLDSQCNFDFIHVDGNPDFATRIRKQGKRVISIGQGAGKGKNRERSLKRTIDWLGADKIIFNSNIKNGVRNILAQQIRNAKLDATGRAIAKPKNTTAPEEQQIHALDCLMYACDYFTRG